jgi:hypothetical protein
VPPDSVWCTREPNSELATFGNSGSHSTLIHRTVRCATGQCLVHQGTQLRTCHLWEFWEPLHYNSPDCPVCQQSNGYPAPTGVCRGTVKRYSARLRAQSQSRRQKALRTVNRTCPVHHRTVQCTTGLSSGPVVRSSNGRNPTAW